MEAGICLYPLNEKAFPHATVAGLAVILHKSRTQNDKITPPFSISFFASLCLLIFANFRSLKCFYQCLGGMGRLTLPSSLIPLTENLLG